MRAEYTPVLRAGPLAALSSELCEISRRAGAARDRSRFRDITLLPCGGLLHQTQPNSTMDEKAPEQPDLLKTVSRSVTYLPRAQPWPGLLDGCPHGPRQEVSTSPSHNSHHCCTSALPTSNFQVSTKTTSTPPCNCRTTERASNERASSGLTA